MQLEATLPLRRRGGGRIDKALSVAAVRVKCRVPTAGFVVLNEILGSDDCAGLNGAERRLISHPC